MIEYNGIKYATNDNELIDSLFNNGEGTLTPLFKIKRTKNAVEYFIDEFKGFGFNKFGCSFKFSKYDRENPKDCRLWYQHTFQAEPESFKANYKKERKEGWSLELFPILFYETY